MEKEDPAKYLLEEHGRLSSRGSWAIVIGLCLFLVLSGILVHRLVPDKPRTWNYGALQTIPGASVYSSVSPQPGGVAPAATDKIPKQIKPWPEAKPLEKLKPLGFQREEP